MTAAQGDPRLRLEAMAAAVYVRISRAADLPLQPTEAPAFDPFTTSYIPQYKSDRQTMSEAAAKAKAAPFKYLEEALAEKNRGLSDQQERHMASAVSAAAHSDVAMAGRVVEILACAVEVGSPLEQLVEDGPKVCRMRLLCVWEGSKKDRINDSDDDTHMTWQFLKQLEPGGDLSQSEINHKCLSKFKQAHDDSITFQKYGWPCMGTNTGWCEPKGCVCSKSMCL